MGKSRPGDTRGLAWEAALSLKPRPEHFVLICYFMAHAYTYTQTHVCARAQAKFSKQGNSKEMCLPLKRSCLFCLFSVPCLCIRRRRGKVSALPFIRRLLSSQAHPMATGLKWKQGALFKASSCTTAASRLLWRDHCLPSTCPSCGNQIGM